MKVVSKEKKLDGANAPHDNAMRFSAPHQTFINFQIIHIQSLPHNIRAQRLRPALALCISFAHDSSSWAVL